jgi:hypothetical protein
MLTRFLTNTGMAAHRAARISVTRCRAPDAAAAVACLEAALRLRRPPPPDSELGPGHRVVLALWGAMSQAPPPDAGGRAWLAAAAPFAIPRAALAGARRGRMRRGRPCLTLQLRLHDRRCGGGGVGGCRVNGVEEARVGDVPARAVLMRAADADTAAWGNLSVVGVVERARWAAARRGLGVYVLMPYARAVFDRLGRMENVTTVQVGSGGLWGGRKGIGVAVGRAGWEGNECDGERTREDGRGLWSPPGPSLSLTLSPSPSFSLPLRQLPPQPCLLPLHSPRPSSLQ